MIEDMVQVAYLKMVAIGMKSGQVDVVHIVVFQHETIVPVFISITQH